MNQLTINIAYIADNQYLINKMVNDLKNSGVSFNLIDGSSFVSEENFYAHLVEDNNPCLLMVSDNFLKSQSCLNKGLAYLQSLIKKEQVFPIIIDGTEIDASGNRQLITTEFEKVSNVIKYMNFWQEKYLDLRKLKRSIPAEEEEEFSDKLKIVRSISSEVGEYLRNLRDSNYFPFPEFSANHYEAFFRIFGDEASHVNFVATQNNNQERIESEQPVEIETPDPKTEQNELNTTEISGPVVEEVSTNKILPFDDLITEKEKIDKLSVEELASVDANTFIEEQEVKAVTSIYEDESIGETLIERVDKANEAEIISLDPEWEKATDEEVEGEFDEDELEGYFEDEGEESLDEIAESEDRPLTETELLALELAQKLPSNENVEIDENQSAITTEEEEEMISLSDLMGEDYIDEKVEVDSSEEISTAESTIISSNIGNVDLFSESNGVMDSYETEDSELEDDDDELEGYFVDEGEEMEEVEEELSEFEVLQSANTLVQSGKVDEGISLLEETLVEAPNFVSVRYQYAAFLAQYQNDFRAASDQLALLLEQEPNNLSAKFFLGELAEVDRDYLTAKNYYEKVHHDNPEFPNVSYKLGMLMVNYLTDTPEVASNYLGEAYQFDNENINALYQFGLIQNEGLNEEEAAIAAFEEVLEKAPEHPFANYDLAVIYHKRGEREKALQFYTKAAEINPELKTAVNDQAFAIAIDAVEAKEQEFVEIAKGETVEESYTISNLVANVQTPNVVGNSANLLSNNISIPPDKVKASDDIVKEVNGPKSLTKIAMITGATSGIGKATATKFAKEGYQLILAGRRFSRLFQLKDQFEKDFDSKVRLLPFDIKSSSAVQEALAELEEDWQGVDILVNNAGLAKGETPIHEGELANWEAMIDTNLKGLLYVTREIAPYMVKRRKGQIINVCSLAGKEVYANNAVYCATKHAVDALSKAMRIDLHKYNIKVSQVSPGYVEDTEFSSVKTGSTENQITDFVPVNAHDVAEVIYFMTTQPNHVTLQEVVMTGTQQANANIIDRSGRK